MSNSCTRRLLAGDSLTRVERCSCGRVHVTVGPVTLHIDGDALARVSDVLAQASAVLEGRNTAPRPNAALTLN